MNEWLEQVQPIFDQHKKFQSENEEKGHEQQQQQEEQKVSFEVKKVANFDFTKCINVSEWPKDAKKDVFIKKFEWNHGGTAFFSMKITLSDG